MGNAGCRRVARELIVSTASIGAPGMRPRKLRTTRKPEQRIPKSRLKALPSRTARPSPNLFVPESLAGVRLASTVGAEDRSPGWTLSVAKGEPGVGGQEKNRAP